MSSAKVEIHNEVKAKAKADSDWILAFQYCTYIYDDGSTQDGYRFIWRRPNDSLQAARGQARIPSVPVALKLIGEAVKRGWAINNIDDDKFTILPPEEEQQNTDRGISSVGVLFYTEKGITKVNCIAFLPLQIMQLSLLH